MNAIEMIARCMLRQEGGGETSWGRESEADQRWINEKLCERALAEEPMGYPGAA